MGMAASCIGNMLAYTCFSLVGECVNFTMSQAARFSYLLIGLLIFSFAVIVGKVYPEKIQSLQGISYSHLDLTSDCNADYTDECIYRQLIYRSGCALACCFIFMAGMSFLSDAANKKFWIAKLFVTAGLFVAFWWGSNSFFSGFAEVSRFLSFLWILVQGLLILDFACDCHDVIMARADEAMEQEGSRTWHIIYLILTGGFLAAAISGLVFLFRDYSDCQLGMFFIVFTLVMGVITTIISALDSVNKGVLTPSIMFAYGVFMCWYALLSSPDEQCNPTADTNDGKKTIALIVTVVVSSVIVLYCVVFGTKILNLFNPDGEGVIKSYAQSGGALQATEASSMNRGIGEGDVELSNRDGNQGHSNVDALYEQTSGTTQERVFFHIIMLLFSFYGVMVLTSWGTTTGSPEAAKDTALSAGQASMWLKIVSQWVFFVLYLRALQVAHEDNQSS